MKNKRLVLLLSIILIFITIIIVSIIINNNKKTPEELLDNKLSEIGKKFYEDFYYDNTSKELLEKLSIDGIRINIDSLKEYEFLNEYFVDDDFSLYNCDTYNSVVMIYPVKPFEKSDYNIKIYLDCNF